MAVRHLVELGHKRIAYAGPQAAFLRGHSSVNDRHETYLSEMSKYGLSPMPGHNKLLSTVKTYDNLHNSAIKFIKESVIQNKATAIISYGHMEGLNLMQAAHILGVSIPEQLSLICFCDQHACDVMSPSLTFIDLMSAEMGQAAAELLIKQMKTPDQSKHETIKLPERLIVRKTTSVAPRN